MRLDRAAAALLLVGFTTAVSAETDSTEQSNAIQRVAPIYPRQAALDGTQGCVVFSAIVLPDGRVDQVLILDSVPKGVFDEAALHAVAQWRFKPPERLGRYAQRIDWKIEHEDGSQGSPLERECVKPPSFEALNPEKSGKP